MSTLMRAPQPHLLVHAICLPLVLLFGVGAAERDATYVPHHDPGKIQGIVNEYKERLSIAHEVMVTIVPSNARLVSVESRKDHKGAFLLSVEDSFLDGLDEDELRAVIAHELGHVWIFTNHPYLQTERLANQIAMRLVSRGSLERVYGKVWARGGQKGDLVRFLGTE